MSSEMGSALKTTVFGTSHGQAIGVTVDSFPPGFPVDMEKLRTFLDRRRPSGVISTSRREPDEPEFLSGLLDGVTTGAPLCAVIYNKNVRSSDYEGIKYTPRPSHADLTAYIKYGGSADMRGGGQFSGRLTAPLCVAGGIALQMLESRGICIGAHLYSVSGIRDDAFPHDPEPGLVLSPGKKAFPVLNDARGEDMIRAITDAAADGDSVGGVIECAVVGLPAGLGGPMFDGIENVLAKNLFGIPAVKGVEFGAGFGAASMRGSEYNDPITVSGGALKTETNNSGGILGGITNGMPVIVRVAVKPTPSIAKKQKTVDLHTGEPAEIEIKGRHDPCVAHRAVPVVEAVCALTVLDIMIQEGIM